MKNYILIYFWSKLTLCTIQNSRFDENPRFSKDTDSLENNSANKTQRKVFTDFSINKILEKSTQKAQNSFSELNESSVSSDRLVIDEDHDSNQSNQDIPVSKHNELDTSTFSNDQNQDQDVMIIDDEHPLDLSTHSKRSMENTVSIPDLSRKRKNSSDLEINNNPKKIHYSKDDQDQDIIIIDDENPLSPSTHSRGSENTDSPLNLSNQNYSKLETANPKTFRYFENIHKSSLLDPEDVISLDLYKYLVELVARIFYCQKELKIFNEYLAKSVIASKEPERIESFEKFLVPFVDKLLYFNEITKTSVDFLADRKKRYYLNNKVWILAKEQNALLAAKEKISNDPIEKLKISKEIKRKEQAIDDYLKMIKEEKRENNFNLILKQISLLKPGHRYHQISAMNLCLIFGPINKIMKYYNDNLRSTFHQYLINLNLSFIPQNRKFIDYTEYNQHPHYLAYLIVDLFYSILSISEENNYGLYLSKINSLGLIPYLNIIFFLSLNRPDTIQEILNDNISFGEFIASIKSVFTNINSEKIKALYKNFEDIRIRCYNNQKQTSLITLESYSQIAEIEKDLNTSLQLFYRIPYVALRIMIRE